jgi:hypothetical protein
LLICQLGREEAEELGELAVVLDILVSIELQVLAKCLIELCEVALVLGYPAEEIHALSDMFLHRELGLTMPLTWKLRYLGIMSSQLSVMKT